ncbi:MAG: hypothetical protein MUQ68_04335, partial [Crocinitomicaceae bacterium]|nr:hypothetical protein [Crocinitomicaceae bacterium]
MTQIQDVLNQLDIFTKKYYKNQLIKGGLLLIGVFIFSLCLISGLEYFGKFNKLIRFSLLFSFIVVNGYIVLNFCVLPLLKLVKLRKGISSIDASRIIGSFFPDVADKLTNLLQLNNELHQSNSSNYILVEASIIQKIKEINIFSFNQAIDYSKTKKYLKLILPVLSLFIFLIIYTPNLFTQGSLRIIKFSEEFIEKSPFSFHLQNTDLTINEGDDLNVFLELKGSDFPKNMYINSENGSFLMKRSAVNNFESKIKKPKNGSVFWFSNEKYTSKKYYIKVLGKSILGKLDADILYPNYIGINKKNISNATDLNIPEGSVVTWKGLTKNTEKIDITLDSNNYAFNSQGFVFKNKIKKTSLLKLILTNKHNKKRDSISYT